MDQASNRWSLALYYYAASTHVSTEFGLSQRALEYHRSPRRSGFHSHLCRKFCPNTLAISFSKTRLETILPAVLRALAAHPLCRRTFGRISPGGWLNGGAAVTEGSSALHTGCGHAAAHCTFCPPRGPHSPASLSAVRVRRMNVFAGTNGFPRWCGFKACRIIYLGTCGTALTGSTFRAKD